MAFGRRHTKTPWVFSPGDVFLFHFLLETPHSDGRCMTALAVWSLHPASRPACDLAISLINNVIDRTELASRFSTDPLYYILMPSMLSYPPFLKSRFLIFLFVPAVLLLARTACIIILLHYHFMTAFLSFAIFPSSSWPFSSHTIFHYYN